jgi:hypothetical protein
MPLAIVLHLACGAAAVGMDTARLERHPMPRPLRRPIAIATRRETTPLATSLAPMIATRPLGIAARLAANDQDRRSSSKPEAIAAQNRRSTNAEKVDAAMRHAYWCTALSLCNNHAPNQA